MNKRDLLGGGAIDPKPLTGRESVTDLVDGALRKGAYACLYKPLDVEEVLRLVEGVSEQKRETGEPA